MFTFHHVNAFQVPAASSNGNGSGNGSGRELLVLDTVGWNQISFESSQHNLSTEYYKGKLHASGVVTALPLSSHRASSEQLPCCGMPCLQHAGHQRVTTPCQAPLPSWPAMFRLWHVSTWLCYADGSMRPHIAPWLRCWPTMS